jgi:Zn-dependent protease
MNQGVLIALSVLAAWLGLQGLTLLVVWVQLMRAPIEPTRSRLNLATPPTLDALPPDQQVWLDDLQALGFEPLALGAQTFRGQNYPMALLRHRSEPAFACITYQPSLVWYYPVTFFSATESGLWHYTCNRQGWTVLAPSQDGTVRHDVYVGSLAEHWAAHQSHLAGLAQQIRAVHVDAATATAELTTRSDAAFERLCKSHCLAQTDRHWHIRPGAAWRMTLAWRRHRKALAKPYQSQGLAGAHLSAFLARVHTESERLLAARPPRLNLKASLLLMSLMIFVVLWGMAFNLADALVLVAILLVHEGGHALAMRLLGWKDMSMFFVPFLGAMVTARPGDVPAWKQAVMLLAGPLPGLFAGLAALALWPAGAQVLVQVQTGGPSVQQVAVMAVAVNLFNLLPITPLDGGQLVELALFSRWPRLRLAFAVLSVLGFAALAISLDSVTIGVMMAVLAIILLSQAQAARLQAQWQEGLTLQAQLTNLFEQARQLFPRQEPARLMANVKAVVMHRQVRHPRWWESLGVLLIMLGAWSAVAGVAWQLGLSGKLHQGAPEARTQAQRAFDTVWYEADDSYEATSGEGESARAHLANLAVHLAPDDPRLTDLAAMQALATPWPRRHELIEVLLQRRRDGQQWFMSRLLDEELDAQIKWSAGQPAAQRLAHLQTQLQWAEKVRPDLLAPTIDTRLRVAEALDELGQSAKALAMLDATRTLASQTDEAPYKLAEVVRSQVWFQLSHQHLEQAQAVLAASSLAPSGLHQADPLAVDRAWALMLAGRNEAALDLLRTAAYTRARPVSWWGRLMGQKALPPHLIYPLDLALALARSGQEGEARAMLGTREAAWACFAAQNMPNAPDIAALHQPWQRERERLGRELALRLCPPPAKAAVGGVGASR